MITTGPANIGEGVSVYKDGKLVCDVFENKVTGAVHVYAYKDAYGKIKVHCHDMTE